MALDPSKITAEQLRMLDHESGIEYAQWLRFVEEWRKLFPTTDINHPACNPIIEAIKAWGESLGALRITECAVEALQDFEASYGG